MVFAPGSGTVSPFSEPINTKHLRQVSPNTRSATCTAVRYYVYDDA